MVMENLFFMRSISKIYDLKGSSRSRYNPDTTGANKVLLDLNLLEALRTKPIFLESKAKRNLERAIWNDTSFLAVSWIIEFWYLSLPHCISLGLGFWFIGLGKQHELGWMFVCMFDLYSVSKFTDSSHSSVDRRHGLFAFGRGRRRGEGARFRHHRFHEAVYMGQAIRDMGEGIRNTRRPEECFPDYHLSETIQETVS